MATKKQKRQAVLARREQFLAQLEADGLKAQQWDKRRREEKAAKAKLDEETTKRRETTTEALGKLLSHELRIDLTRISA